MIDPHLDPLLTEIDNAQRQCHDAGLIPVKFTLERTRSEITALRLLIASQKRTIDDLRAAQVAAE